MHCSQPTSPLLWVLWGLWGPNCHPEKKDEILQLALLTQAPSGTDLASMGMTVIGEGPGHFWKPASLPSTQLFICSGTRAESLELFCGRYKRSPHLQELKAYEQRCGRFCYKYDYLNLINVVNSISWKPNSQCHKVGKTHSECTCQVAGAVLIVGT